MDCFTLYKECYELISILPKSEANELLGAITEYMFYDKEPEDLNNHQLAIFKNLQRPLNKTKIRSVIGAKGGANAQAKRQAKVEANIQANAQAKRQAHQDVYVNGNVNVLEKIGSGEEKPLETADDVDLFTETVQKIVEHLNQKTNSKFKSSSKQTQKHINARLNEGYSLDDFIVVIDKKVADWTNTEFEKYLNPETLFGSKFEKYLNQKVTKKKIEIQDKPWDEPKKKEMTAAEKAEIEELLSGF